MINIQDIIPFMKDGWVAMDENEVWCWFENEPHRESSINGGYWQSSASEIVTNYCFQDIAPADDWATSLIKIDNTVREKFEKEYQNNIQRTIQELKQDD